MSKINFRSLLVTGCALSVFANSVWAQAPLPSTANPSSNKILPLWWYNNVSPRDGNGYAGVMVGKNPFGEGGSSQIPTYVLPITFTINTVATAVDINTGTVTASKPAVEKFDLSAPDTNCLAAPNVVPLTLLKQSPIFQKSNFTLGGTFVGNTQYIDAFQRANFWRILEDRNSYHVLLDPVTILAPLTVSVPADKGVAVPEALEKTIIPTPGLPASPTCGDFALVDISWFSDFLTNTALPAVSAKGATTGSLPIFMFYRTRLAFAPTFEGCCTGYHSSQGSQGSQTYIVSNFGYYSDVETLSHEVGEWVNDPILFNPVPLAGYSLIGQNFCQGNLEVGDPLETHVFTQTMPNGRAYHLQELAFYSWFFGGPPTGVNGWYSNQNTFTTDAGPCH